MKKRYFMGLLVCSLVFVGCSSGAPKCDSKEALQLLEESAKKGWTEDMMTALNLRGPEARETLKQYVAYMDKEVKIKSTNFRIEKKDDERKVTRCKADVVGEFPVTDKKTRGRIAAFLRSKGKEVDRDLETLDFAVLNIGNPKIAEAAPTLIKGGNKLSREISYQVRLSKDGKTINVGF